jgi:hypothetical protein
MLSESISDVVYGHSAALAYNGVFVSKQVVNYLFIVNHLSDRNKSFVLHYARFILVLAGFQQIWNRRVENVLHLSKYKSYLMLEQS